MFVNNIPGTFYDMASSLQYGCTPLMEASRLGHVQCVKVLLDWGAQVNLQNKVSAVPDQINALADMFTCAMRGCEGKLCVDY